MKFLKITLLSVLTLILLSCFGNRNNPNQNNNQTGNVERGIQNERDAIDRDYEAKVREDEDRDEVLRRSRERYSEDICEDDDDRDAECKDICKEIYGTRKYRNKCEELSIDQIARLEELHEWLEDPDEDELGEVDFDDFDVYLNIDIGPLDKLVAKEYNKADAREFLTWLILNPDFAAKFEKEDDDYDTLTRLLKYLHPFENNGSDIHQVFLAKLGRDKLIEVIIEEGDEETMEWFMDYINTNNDACDEDETSLNCFKVYCKIGNKISLDDRDDWLEIEEFENYIEDIIEAGVNKDSDDSTVPYEWGGLEIEDVNDLTDWVNNLCKNAGNNRGSDLTQ